MQIHDEEPITTQLEKVTWRPEELIDVGHGCQVGITTDDHCFLVLVQDWYGNWKPSKWIPIAAARRLGELASPVNCCK